MPDPKSKTFTETVKKRYEKARKENENNKVQHEVYSVATSEGITKRCINLKNRYVFCTCEHEDATCCEQCMSKAKNNVLKEYRLQAFLIKRALMTDNIHTNWVLPFETKRWRLLDAERNFASADLDKTQGDGRKLDILAYEEETKSFIVLELKKDWREEVKEKANNELKRYTSTIQKNIEDANDFYSVHAQNVKGYIVYPSVKRSAELIKETKDLAWGLLEYDRKYLDDIENIKYQIVKEPD